MCKLTVLIKIKDVFALPSRMKSCARRNQSANLHLNMDSNMKRRHVIRLKNSRLMSNFLKNTILSKAVILNVSE
jgi:hypothetical protein